MKRIDELTGIRCIAVGMVVIAHTGHVYGHTTRLLPDFQKLFGDLGDGGVQIFFVLSGFLITSLLMGEYARDGKISFGAFYLRRAYRITPAFYVYIAAIGLLGVAGLTQVSWQQILISAVYIWNYAHLFGIAGTFKSHAEGAWYLGHTWSLAMEEQFYWFWPALFLFIMRRKSTRLLPAIILIEPIIRIASYILFRSQRDYLHIMFHTGIDTILIGCYVALNKEMLNSRFQKAISSGWVLTVLAVLVVLVFPKIEARIGGFWIITYGATIQAAAIGLMLLCILAQRDHWFCKLLRTRGFVFMGTISYSLYLWQQLFNDYKAPGFLGFPLNIVEAIAAATLSYYVVERPFLALKDRLHKPQGRPDVAIAPNTHPIPVTSAE